MRHYYDDVMSALCFSQQDAKSAKKVAETLPEGRLKSAWSNGRYYLLPSFLKVLWKLQSLNTANSNEYAIVFRTFGDDIPDVAMEIECCIKGTHPLYLGKKLDSSFALLPPYATFHRTESVTTLRVGTLQTGIITETALEKNIERVIGYGAIHDRIMNMLLNKSTIALRDDWAWWNDHGEIGECGKVYIMK